MIRLCRSNPIIVNNVGDEVAVRNGEAQLLRVLLLAPEPVVPTVAASTAMKKNPNGFGNYVDGLRTAFGDKALVPRGRSSVWFAGDRSDTDAAVIQTYVAKIAAEMGFAGAGQMWTERDLTDWLYRMQDPDPAMDEQTARAILPLLEKIESLYGGSPALGLHELEPNEFPDAHRDWAESLIEVASHWMTLWASVQLLVADCHLRLGSDRNTGLHVVTKLLKLARTPDPPEEVWSRLLRAAKLSQKRVEQDRAWTLVEGFYAIEGRAIPSEFFEYKPEPPVAPNTPLAPHKSRPLSIPLEPAGDTTDHLHEIAEVLGITPGSTLRLRGEVVDPMTCLKQTQRLLYFSGVLGSKWVDTPAIRAEFDRLLTRLDDHGEYEIPVRFLIMDPNGDAYSELFQLRGGALSADSIPYLRALATKHVSFEVRVVDALPSFRILVLDEEWVSFSPYALEAERYATSQYGWEAPHILLDPRAPYPLAEAFKVLFNERWNNASPL